MAAIIDEFTEARTLTRRLKAVEAKRATALADLDAKRDKLLAEAAPEVRAMALASLAKEAAAVGVASEPGSPDADAENEG